METISQIKEKFRSSCGDELVMLCSRYGSDERAGVKALVRAAQSGMRKLSDEKDRIRQMKTMEREYGKMGLVCGIDEAGRGPLAGPVVACALILPQDSQILYVNDSKKLSAGKREELYKQITHDAVSFGVGIIFPERIDEINILQATYEAMKQAVCSLTVEPGVLLNDAVRIPGIGIPQVPVVKGDAKCYCIAGASIIAKVTRDRMMEELDREYPEYGFAANKGYGSASHIAALKKYGPCPVHRRSFITHFS